MFDREYNTAILKWEGMANCEWEDMANCACNY